MMDYILLFWIAIAGMFCSGLFIEIIRPRVNKIMKNVDQKYSGNFNNYLDGFRVLKAFRRNKIVRSKERQLLLLHIIMNLVSHLALIILIAVLVLGPGLMNILNP